MERQHLSKLHRILSTRFSLEEFRTFCFDLGVNFDTLPGEGLKGKARELVMYCERHKRIRELIETGKRQRSDIAWPAIIEAVEQDSSALKDAVKHYLESPLLSRI